MAQVGKDLAIEWTAPPSLIYQVSLCTIHAIIPSFSTIRLITLVMDLKTLFLALFLILVLLITPFRVSTVMKQIAMEQ